MFDRDTNQKLRTPGRGQEITAALIMKIRALIIGTVKPGPGIIVQRQGEAVFIGLENGGKGGSGGSIGGGGDAFHIEAETKAALPSAASTNRRTIGFITTGGDVGMVCVINPDQDGWDAINVLE